MALPHTFISGDVARSQEVNENFNYIMQLLGTLSTSGRLEPPGEFLLGARFNTLMTGAQDTGGSMAREFFQVGWNADYNNAGGGIWKFARFIQNRPATAMRLGRTGFEILTTSETSGNLDAQMKKIFAVRATKDNPNADFVFIDPTWSIQGYDGDARNEQDYRLLYTPMATPGKIYENQTVYEGQDSLSASQFGVPTNAKAILVGGTWDGDIRIGIQQRQGGSTPQHTKYGALLSSGEQAIINLGSTSSVRGKFYVIRYGTTTATNLYIQGYYS